MNVQCFLQICEAEVVCELCNLVPESIRERDPLVVLEFLLPILSVQNSFFEGGVLEQTLVE